MSLGDGGRFWEGFSLVLNKKYDLSGIGRVVVGGDGAPWVKEGAEILGGSYQLDRFHLRRELLRALKGDVATANSVYEACITGNVVLADTLLRSRQLKSEPEAAAEINKVRGYLLNNAQGLVDYRLQLDDTENALVNYNKVIAFAESPYYEDALLNKAQILIELDKRKSAINSLNQLKNRKGAYLKKANKMIDSLNMVSPSIEKNK